MIRPLRKYHFLIWRILAVLLPVVFCLAIVLRSESPKEHEQINKDDFGFKITKLTSDSGQLTIEVRNSLTVPSCLVYLSSPPQNILLGKIDQTGSYHFDTPIFEKAVTIRLYDPIHKKEIIQSELFYNK
jgi:hypothetical protein